MATLESQDKTTDEWNTGAVSVDDYLARLGLSTPPEPSVAALRTLHEAHVRTIPFENIDVVLGRHPGIDLDVIQRKLLENNRGGYCFEHALLFAAVLERLGFTVSRHMARVQPLRPGPYTHMMLLVWFDEGAYLADVGFGAGVSHPLPLRDGAVVEQAGVPHRMHHDGTFWHLQKRNSDGWESLHAFQPIPSRFVDYEVAHHHTATHPNSPFVGKPVVMRPGREATRKLLGDELVVEHASGEVERTPVPGHELGRRLRELDVELTEEELTALRAELGR
ncbi:arylamine N-acetyltransferase [Actinopolyspora erythraea]|uniref:Arylamine N-acetyltransferase n=1 Tax=Actinopolyspora erythraea TaxID=414996 RepID=A0A099D395_9ACTN|nr:arylamine N-acetyltransferase [Actinopolyspora erythraea]ASU78048.1 arylamine N-acetyltransferase [Actinopolyspora erythraea]KGI79815.1 arylamine N-acetyltransferase [Actinopolyspora erythraea]